MCPISVPDQLFLAVPGLGSCLPLSDADCRSSKLVAWGAGTERRRKAGQLNPELHRTEGGELFVFPSSLLSLRVEIRQSIAKTCTLEKLELI